MGNKLRTVGLTSIIVIAILVALSFNFELMSFEQQLWTLVALALFIIIGLCSMRLLVPATKQSESY